jgi:C-terminal processing protease CtpA/Prc
MKKLLLFACLLISQVALAQRYTVKSYIQDEKTFDQFFNEGKFYGYGFGMKLDASQNLRVSFVYKDSPMDRVGVTRGYKITKINGKTVAELIATNSLTSAWGENKAGVERKIEVEGLDGVKREETIVKEEVQINTVVHHEVKSLNGKKVGYLVFNSFVDTSIEELNEAFSHFGNEGISDLVLDLRYNGGGSMKVAERLDTLGAIETSTPHDLESYTVPDARGAVRSGRPVEVRQGGAPATAGRRHRRPVVATGRRHGRQVVADSTSSRRWSGMSKLA